MASLRKRGKVWYFRYTDADGHKQEAKGCTDKRATEEIARQTENDAAEIRAGLVDAKDLVRRGHSARSLADHLAEFKLHTIAKGSTEKHADLFVGRAARIAALVRGAKLSYIEPGNRATRHERAKAAESLSKILRTAQLSDLNAERVQASLSTLRAEGRSLATCNHLLPRSGRSPSGVKTRAELKTTHCVE